MLKKILIIIQIIIFVTLPLIAVAQTDDDGINDVVIMIHDYGSAKTADYYKTIRSKSGGNNDMSWDWESYFSGNNAFFDYDEIYLPNISDDENGNGSIEEDEEDTQDKHLGILSHENFNGFDSFDIDIFESNPDNSTQSMEMRDHLISGQVIKKHVFEDGDNNKKTVTTETIQNIPQLFNGEDGKEIEALLLAHSQGGGRAAAYAIDQRLFRSNEYFIGKFSGNWDQTIMRAWDKSPTVRGLITIASLLNGGVPAVNNIHKGILENRIQPFGPALFWNDALAIYTLQIFNISMLVNEIISILAIKSGFNPFSPNEKVMDFLESAIKDFGVEGSELRPGGEDLAPDSKFFENYMGGNLTVSNIVYAVPDGEGGYVYYYHIPEGEFNAPDFASDMADIGGDNDIANLGQKISQIRDTLTKIDTDWKDNYIDEFGDFDDNYDFYNEMGIMELTRKYSEWPMNLFTYETNISESQKPDLPTDNVFNRLRTKIEEWNDDSTRAVYDTCMNLLNKMKDYYNINIEIWNNYDDPEYIQILYQFHNGLNDINDILGEIENKIEQNDAKIPLSQIGFIHILFSEIYEILFSIDLSDDIPYNLIYSIYEPTEEILENISRYSSEPIDPVTWDPPWWQESIIDGEIPPYDPNWAINPTHPKIVQEMIKLRDRFVSIDLNSDLDENYYQKVEMERILNIIKGTDTTEGLKDKLMILNKSISTIGDGGFMVTFTKPLADVYYASISGGESHPIELFHDFDDEDYNNILGENFPSWAGDFVINYWTITGYLGYFMTLDTSISITTTYFAIMSFISGNIGTGLYLTGAATIATTALTYSAPSFYNFTFMEKWFAEDFLGAGPGNPADCLIPSENGQYPVDLIGGMPLVPDDKINIPNVDTQYSHFHYPDLVHGWSSTNPETSKSVTDNYEVMQRIEDLMGDYENKMNTERNEGIIGGS
jgi:hypothetical protein